jgi:DNA-binding MarR family transcriptional regulator
MNWAMCVVSFCPCGTSQISRAISPVQVGRSTARKPCSIAAWTSYDCFAKRLAPAVEACTIPSSSALAPVGLIATLAWLAGSCANEHLLRVVRGSKNPKVRNAHGYVFQHLLGRPRTVGELAELLGVSQQAASKVVVELEALGYVERHGDGSDKRVRRILLSRRGAAIVEQVGQNVLDNSRKRWLSGGLAAVSKRRVKPPST